MIAYVIPTRDRAVELARTLGALGSLPRHEGQVIVVDNASCTPACAPRELANGLAVDVVRLPANIGAAARNVGVERADQRAEWIVMLDDDSHPMDAGFINVLASRASDVLAVQAEIWLRPPGQAPGPRRESGGLPEVFIGCGVALRRRAFIEAGGYDASFDYYAEEYDLAARLLLMGGRVEFDPAFRVHHRKSSGSRSMNRILRRLVRNNVWVMRRYAPGDVQAREVRRTVFRYAKIAAKERARAGYARGLLDLCATLPRQARRAMPTPLWDRFTGLAACRSAMQRAFERSPFHRACLVARGKNDHLVERALRELGVGVVGEPDAADARVIATLSPGPMLDACDALRQTAGPAIICPWLPGVGPDDQLRTAAA